MRAQLELIATPRVEWTRRIIAAWQKTLPGIFGAGTELIAAKADPDMKHGDFEAMIEEDLPFTPSTAQRLMAISHNLELVKPAHGQFLPVSWRTLYELTKLSPDQFNKGIASESLRCSRPKAGQHARLPIVPGGITARL
jgi:hypothetical protein